MATIEDRAVRVSEFNDFRERQFQPLKDEVKCGFDEVERRFDEVDNKFEAIEDRLDRLEYNMGLLIVNLLSEEEANKALWPPKDDIKAPGC